MPVVGFHPNNMIHVTEAIDGVEVDAETQKVIPQCSDEKLQQQFPSHPAYRTSQQVVARAIT